MKQMVKEERIRELVEQLTLEEKIGMIHGDGLFRTKGVERIGIPPLKMSDGPMGVRAEFENSHWIPVGNSDDYVTYMPCSSALAATWNRELAKQAGTVLGEEARGRGKDVILAPGINIKRSPLCGRNFEYLSEDPYLAGEMAVPFIQGIQTADVAACLKHFALNNQETDRLWVDVKVSPRALREIYLPAFEKAVEEANPYSMMGAYNLYLGEHCCESDVLLNQILRQEWGYDGAVISDWGAVHNTEKAACSELDLEMSVFDNFDDYCLAKPLEKEVEAGRIDEAVIDRKVANLLRLMMRLKMIPGLVEEEGSEMKNPGHVLPAGEGECPTGEADLEQLERKAGEYNTPQHRQAVLDVARESIVLLKNEEKQLPLCPKKQKKILVIGDNADRQHSNGGGSAEIKALYEITPLMGIRKLLGGNCEVTYVPGYYADDMEKEEAQINWQAASLNGEDTAAGLEMSADEESGLKASGITEPGMEASEEAEKNAAIRKEYYRRERAAKLREQALELAQKSDYDTVLFIGGQNHNQDLEGHDRPDMKLPYDQDCLIEGLLSVRPDTVVVIVSGSPVEMPWIADVRSLIWHWYAGMEGGTALAEVLFGRVNPSGRLTESFPIFHKDCSAHAVGEFGLNSSVAYKEGIFVGYRYYDTCGRDVLFPFGYGLSYTEFVMENLEITETEDAIHVAVQVTNVGETAGKETVQVYVGKKESAVERALKELKGFEKTELMPGETKKVSIAVKKRELRYYDEQTQAYRIENGAYQIYVGRSAADIAVTGTVDISGC